MSSPIVRLTALGILVLSGTSPLVLAQDPPPHREEAATIAPVLLGSGLAFRGVPRGGSQEKTITIHNPTSRPITILEVRSSLPEVVAVAHPGLLAPWSSGEVVVRFTPAVADEYEGTLEVAVEPPLPAPARIPVSGTVADFAEVPLAEGTELVWTGDAAASEDCSAVTFSLAAPPIGPTHSAPLMVLTALVDGIAVPTPRPEARGAEPAVVGEPEAVAVSLSRSQVRLGGFEPLEVSVSAPGGLETLGGELRIRGDVYVDGAFAFSVLSAPRALAGLLCPRRDCECPQGCPEPTLTTEHVVEGMPIPDAQPPPLVAPSDNPVGFAQFIVKGPKLGECCKGGKFAGTLTVDSQRRPGVNRWQTALFLLGSFCGKYGLAVDAATDGISQPVVRGPGDPNTGTFPPFPLLPCALIPDPVVNAVRFFELLKPRAQLATTYRLDTVCDGQPCACRVKKEQYKTVFDLSNPNANDAGGLEVFWKVNIAGADCKITAVGAEVTRILYLHGATEIYDPARDRLLRRTGDDDGDRFTNYAELLAGSKTNDRNSTPLNP